MASDTDGDVVVAGWTDAELFGPANGSLDAFVRRLDPDGTPRWARQFATAAADGDASVFTFGHTSGALGDTNPGNIDAFVRKSAR
ncbi:MAG: hypothetical protein ACNA8N_13230 [Trueperaceae bacterium]